MPSVTGSNIYARVVMLAERAVDLIVDNESQAPIDAPFYRHGYCLPLCRAGTPRNTATTRVWEPSRRRTSEAKNDDTSRDQARARTAGGPTVDRRDFIGDALGALAVRGGFGCDGVCRGTGQSRRSHHRLGAVRQSAEACGW